MDNFLGDLSVAELTTIDIKTQVKISNRLVGAKCNLNVLQWTLLFALIAAMDSTAQTMGFYKVSSAEVADLLCIKGKNRLRVIRDLCSTLVGAKLYLRINNAVGDFYYDELTWFSRLRTQANNPFILFRMEEDLAEFLLNQEKGYIKLKLDELLQFRRKYTFQIFCICVKNKKFGAQSFWLTDLAEQLCCPKSYLTGKLFEEKVLEPAIKEINMHTELQVSYTIANGEKLKLSIKEKDKYASFFDSLNPEAQIAYTYFVDQIKVTKSAIIHCVNTYGEDVLTKIYLQFRHKPNNGIKNMAAYAATCLRNGYFTEEQEPPKKIRKPDVPIPPVAPNDAEKEKIREQQKADELKAQEERKKQLEELNSLPENEQKVLYQCVLDFAKEKGAIKYMTLKQHDYESIKEKEFILTMYLNLIKAMKEGNTNGTTSQR